jgi:hypothetical protein
MKNEDCDVNILLHAAGRFNSRCAIHSRTPRSFPLVAVLAIAGSAFAQNTAYSVPTTPLHNNGQSSKLPGERMTSAQKRVLTAFGPDVSVTFNDQEVPSSITGRLSGRANSNDPAAEARSALDQYGPAFRRGPNDSFTFDSAEADKTGVLHVRMNQTYKGLPVEGRQLTVLLTPDEVVGINGNFLPDLDIAADVVGGSATALVSSATSFAENEGYQDVKALRARGPAVFIDAEDMAHVAIPVEITHTPVDGNDHEEVFVETSSGQPLAARVLPRIGAQSALHGHLSRRSNFAKCGLRVRGRKLVRLDQL